jgi:hypothetical protein
MTKLVYDPNTVEGDVFDMDNMVEGSDTKILTSSERSEIAVNTNKISFDSVSSTRLANTSGTNTGDQDISGISINAGNININAVDILELQTFNTGINTGDQDISGIAENAGKILTLETNNTGVNTGDQDISGISINATNISTNASDISALQNQDLVSKIVAGTGISISPGSGIGEVTINATGSGVDYSEWATYIGTRSGGNLVSTIGDYDSSGNGTTLKVNDSLEQIIASKVIKANAGIESDFNNGITLNNSSNDGKVTLKATTISSSSDINLEVQDVDGTIALVSQIPIISDIAYGPSWDGDTGAASKNAIYDEIESILASSGVASIIGGTNITVDQSTGNVTISNDINISDNAYGVLWDSNSDGATKNAIYDEIESVKLTIPTIEDTVYNVSWLGDTDGASKNSIYNKIESLDYGVTSITVGAGLNIDQSTGDVTITSDLIISTDDYGIAWLDDPNGASKGVLYTEIESVKSTIPTIEDTAYGIAWSGNVNGASMNSIYNEIQSVKGTIPTIDNSAFSGLWSGDLDGTSKDSIYNKIVSVEATITPISDLAYSALWNTNTDGASKNSIYTEIESVKTTIKPIEDTAYSALWLGDEDGASKNSIYNKIETLMTSSNLQDTLDTGNSATGADANTTLVLDVEGTSSFSFEKTLLLSNINYGIKSNSSTSTLFHQDGDSLSSVLVGDGSVQLVTHNVSDGSSKTILNIPTAHTDSFEFQVNLPRPTVITNTEVTMPISVNNIYADANGNIDIPVTAGVTSIIAGSGISISPGTGLGNVQIDATGGSNLLTTKGDLYTYSTDADRLGVGTDTQILSANSATTTGLEWIDAPSAVSLQDVTDIGSISTNAITIPSLNLGTTGNLGVISTEALTAGRSYTIKNEDGTFAFLTDIPDTKSILVTDTNVSTTYDFDWSNDTWELIVTAITTFSESNLPTTGVNTKVITIYMTGDFAITWPTGWDENKIGSYDGTVLNQIVIEFRKNGSYFMTINQPDV